MRSRAFTPAILLAATTFLPACFMGDFALKERASLVETRALNSDGTFHLKNINGRVEVSTWNEPRVRIEAEKAAASAHGLALIEITIEGQGSRVDVITHHKRHGFFSPPNKVDYHITVPEGARVEVETVNGSVELERLHGAIRASTVNGSMHIDGARGAVEATTVNGSIHATYGLPGGDGRNRFSTTNGSVTVSVPRNCSGEFEAQTVNGGISTDFPFEVSGKWGPKQLRGKLGDGKGSFEITTVNGSVRINSL
jgi:hypothetical protein